MHVYLPAFVGAQNFKREDQGVSFAKFVKASSVKLDVIKLASQKVSKLGECTFECINSKDCYSVNFGGILDGKYSCELLGTDRFKESSKLVASEEFDYYYIKVKYFSLFEFFSSICFMPAFTIGIIIISYLNLFTLSLYM